MSTRERTKTSATEDRNYRGLWGAVVLQAKADIQTEPLRSIEYAHAVAFFTGGGEWVRTRTAIADFLELHRDDLEALGRRCINERRASEGLEPLPPQPRCTRTQTPRPAAPHPASRPAPRPAQCPVAPMAAPATPALKPSNRFFPRGIYATA